MVLMCYKEIEPKRKVDHAGSFTIELPILISQTYLCFILQHSLEFVVKSPNHAMGTTLNGVQQDKPVGILWTRGENTENDTLVEYSIMFFPVYYVL